MCCSQQNERNWKSEKHFDIRYGDAEFGVCGFWSYFGLVFIHYALFQNGKVYSVSLYVDGI